MGNHADDEGGHKSLDALAGTPVGKFLKMARERDAREADEARAGIEDLMKRLGIGDDGMHGNEASETPKRKTLSRARMVELLKDAERNPCVRAALEKAAQFAGSEKDRPGGSAERSQEAGPVERTANALDEAELKALARLLRRGAK